jgi:hypothetical protein
VEFNYQFEDDFTMGVSGKWMRGKVDGWRHCSRAMKGERERERMVVMQKRESEKLRAVLKIRSQLSRKMDFISGVIEC